MNSHIGQGQQEVTPDIIKGLKTRPKSKKI